MNSPTEPDMRARNALAELHAGIFAPPRGRAVQRGLAEKLFSPGTVFMRYSGAELPKLAVPTCARRAQVGQCNAAPIPQPSTIEGAACAASEQAAPSGRSASEPPEVVIAWERATIRLSNACERLTRSIETLMGASGIALIPAVRRFVDDGIVFLNEAGNRDVDRRAFGSNVMHSVSRGGGSSNDARPSR